MDITSYSHLLNRICRIIVTIIYSYRYATIKKVNSNMLITIKKINRKQGSSYNYVNKPVYNLVIILIVIILLVDSKSTCGMPSILLIGYYFTLSGLDPNGQCGSCAVLYYRVTAMFLQRYRPICVRGQDRAIPSTVFSDTDSIVCRLFSLVQRQCRTRESHFNYLGYEMVQAGE